MTSAKFEENPFRIDGEIAENHAILVNLTASIVIVFKHVELTYLKMEVLVSEPCDVIRAHKCLRL